MKKYFIYTLPYSSSNGIKMLYQLAQKLNEAGFEAELVCFGKKEEGYKYAENISDYSRENDIIVYPECVKGNPLCFKNVIRWVLYYPDKQDIESYIKNNECIFTWKDAYLWPDRQNYTQLRLQCIDTKIFYDDNSPKTQDCYFVHKNGKFREIPELKNAVEINMSYPATREELGNLLRTTGTLYSYDDCTLLLQEAKMCGAKVKIITKDDIIDDPEDYLDYSEETCEKLLNNFISITQNYNYTQKESKLKRFFNIFSKKLSIKLRIIIYTIMNRHCGLDKFKNMDKCFSWGFYIFSNNLKTHKKQL